MTKKMDCNLKAYENHYSLIAHYSGLLHKGRMAFITLSLLVWAYVLGIRPMGSGFVINLFGLSITGVASISYISSIFIIMLSLMEISYYKRYFSIVQSGIALEEKLEIIGYFRGFKSAFLGSFLSFNFAVPGLLFLVSLWLWVPVFKICGVKAFILNASLFSAWVFAAVTLYNSASGLIQQQKSIAKKNISTEHTF